MVFQKRHFQMFGTTISKISNEAEREKQIGLVSQTFRQSNPRFDEGRFREFIERRRTGKSMKGLRVNNKYMF